jgi:predicted DNA-binding transcriptional regulator AlpA
MQAERCTDMQEQILLSRRDGAQLLGMSLRSIDYAIAQGFIRPRRIGRRVMLPRAELLRFASKDHGQIVLHRTKRGGA